MGPIYYSKLTTSTTTQHVRNYTTHYYLNGYICLINYLRHTNAKHHCSLLASSCIYSFTNSESNPIGITRESKLSLSTSKTSSFLGNYSAECAPEILKTLHYLFLANIPTKFCECEQWEQHLAPIPPLSSTRARHYFKKTKAGRREIISQAITVTDIYMYSQTTIYSSQNALFLPLFVYKPPRHL